MSSEWKNCTLGDVLTLQRGMDLPIQDRKSGHVPIVASNGIVGYHNVAPVKGPGVLIGRSGSIGGGQYIKEDFWPLNTTLWVKDFKGNNPRFCYFLLRSIDFSSLNAGSGVPTLNRNHLHPMSLACPPIEEQSRISEMLGSLDDRIALLRETNATLEAIAQALFKSWFVDFDPVRAKQQGREPEGAVQGCTSAAEGGMPVAALDAETAAFFPDSFEESELGLVPSGWQVGKVEQLLELAYGKALKASDRIVGAIPVYGSGGVTGYHNEALVNTSSIIIGRKGTVGSLYWEDRPFFPIDTVFYVKTKEPLTYCFYQLQRLGLEGMNTDGAVPGLNRNNVYRLPIVLPSHEVLMAFDEIVSPVRQKIFANSEQAQTLAALRDTLLPRLISGQLRLPDTEAILEDS
ncbi:MAG: restriction endonuclease subunit S [Methylobacter sp.]|jgi:type I restriction enzyme S subunit|nr:restriction endonuclease subunit S [Methylobacter sp.]